MQQAGRHTVTIVTQNVDALHEAAGAQVLHMHGRLAGALCASCGHRWDAPPEMSTGTACPACGARATRPDVVWFGEVPHHLPEIDAALAAADLFAAIGTSGQVHPAAGFAEIAAAAGARTVELNLEPTAARFDDRLSGAATQTVPAWVEGLLS